MRFSLLTFGLLACLSPSFGGDGPSRRENSRAMNVSMADRILAKMGEAQGLDDSDVSVLRAKLAERAASNNGDSDSGYVTHDEFAAVLATIGGGLSLPAPIRSTNTNITTSSTTLALTGTFREGAFFVAVVTFTGPSTVQTNQRSCPTGLSLTIDGQNIQGGQVMPPIPLGIYTAFAVNLDRGGTSLGGTLGADFVANDDGNIWYGVFSSEREARDFLSIAR